MVLYVAELTSMHTYPNKIIYINCITDL